MTRRCSQAVFIALLLSSVFQAVRFENTTTAQVDDQLLSVDGTDVVSSQLSATDDVTTSHYIDVTEAVTVTQQVTATEDIIAEKNNSWNLLERVRVFSTMTTSYNWSARFEADRDRDKTFTVVFPYWYVPGYYYDTLNVKQAGGYVTAAIEDFCRRPGNNRLKDYYFE